MKNILIFGDSYSTYEGFIPKGYSCYYSEQGRDKGPSVTKMKLEETWWKQVLSLIDAKLLLNNSWSGSTISYTGRNNEDCSKTSSFIYRFRQLNKKRFFKKNTIDMVFVFGGTNDSWSQVPLGDMKLSDWEEKDLYFVLPAICHFMASLKKELPQAEIYFIINTELKIEIEECIKKAGQYYSFKTIELKNIEKEFGHPNVEGMRAICNQVFDAITKNK